MSLLSIKGILFLILLIFVLPQIGSCFYSDPYYYYDDYDDYYYYDDNYYWQIIPRVPGDELPVGIGVDEEILDERNISSAFDNFYLYAQNDQFLGYVNSEYYDATSLCDTYGSYGSHYSYSSIFYPYSRYGSSYSDYSAYNDFADFPPILYEDDVPIAYVTTNDIFLPRVDPFYLMDLLNSFSCGVHRW